MPDTSAPNLGVNWSIGQYRIGEMDALETYVGHLGILQEFSRIFKFQRLVSRVDVFEVRKGRILDAVVKVREESGVLVFRSGFL